MTKKPIALNETITSTPGQRTPLHEAITEELIEELVHCFYGKIRTDDLLGPIFNRVIKDNWPTHLERMCVFWSSIALKTGAYKGKPVPKHLAIDELTPDHFTHWLSLFRQTANEVCGTDIGNHFIEKAELIAESLQLALFFKTDITNSRTFNKGELQ